MHPAVPRRAAARRARADGARFLVIRPRRQPQGAGDVPAASSFGKSLAAASDAGGDVSPVDARDVHDLKQQRIVGWASVPTMTLETRCDALVGTARRRAHSPSKAGVNALMAHPT